MQLTSEYGGARSKRMSQRSKVKQVRLCEIKCNYIKKAKWWGGGVSCACNNLIGLERLVERRCFSLVTHRVESPYRCAVLTKRELVVRNGLRKAGNPRYINSSSEEIMIMMGRGQRIPGGDSPLRWSPPWCDPPPDVIPLTSQPCVVRHSSSLESQLLSRFTFLLLPKSELPCNCSENKLYGCLCSVRIMK